MSRPVRCRRWIVGGATALLLAGLVACVPPGGFGGAGGYGRSSDVAYARTLWRALERAHLAGEQAIHTRAFAGRRPHGELQELFDGPLSVAGHGGRVIVLRNYDGRDATSETVANQPHRFLKSIAVMFQRAGYNPAHRDWFWAEYRPYGRLSHDHNGNALAGRVAQCSSCHRRARGGDYVFDPE